MRKKIIRFRGIEVTKKEIFSDFIFLLVAFLISLFALFIFDVHWSFYPGESLFPPSKYVGISSNVYILGSLIGSIVGFFIIKLFLIGVKEDLK